MPKYMTKQRKALLAYLANHTDEPLTARQIFKDLADQGVSLSAVYRNLGDLEKERYIKRCSISSTREVFYQYLAEENCKGRLHLSCKLCGKTFHMDRDSTEYLISKVAENEKFRIDKSETVLYGICQDCAI